MGDWLKERLGQAFIVENKPGAGGNIGTDAVAKAEPDGSTIGISLGGPLAINTLLFSKLPYDPQKDIAPITLLTPLPSVLAVSASLHVKTVAELVALLKLSGYVGRTVVDVELTGAEALVEGFFQHRMGEGPAFWTRFTPLGSGWVRPNFQNFAAGYPHIAPTLRGLVDSVA